MGRQVAIATALLVSVGVFTWLAGPLLVSQFGTEALIAVYAVLAAAAGALTYVLFRSIELRPARRDSDPTDEVIDTTATELDDGAIDEEIQRMKDD